MSRLTRRTGAHVTAAIALAALAGCSESTNPVRVTSASPIIIIGGHPIVLTAQLRAIGNPDEKPLNAVVGTIQLAITGSEEEGFVASWQVHFANPECDASTAFGGAGVMIHDPEDMPGPEDVAVLRLLAPGASLGCGDNFLEGASSISGELAARLVQDPEDFVATFYIIDGSVIAGVLQVAGAPVLESR